MDIYESKNIKPMLLNEVDKPFDDEKYLYEIKFDGIRAILYVNKDEIIIKNKSCLILNEVYPELINIKENIKKKCIFDGEIVLMLDGKPSFQKLQERALLKNKRKIKYFENNFPVTFVCFDILYENKNLTNLELTKRKEILSKYQDTEYFVKSRVVENEGTKLFRFVKKQDLEGIVAKLKTSKYLIGERTDNWIKIKNIKEGDFIIGAYQEKEHVASIILGRWEDNKLYYVSKVVVGKKKKDYKLIKSCKKIKNKFIDFDDPNYIYIEPKYTCTINFLEKTKDNHLRHPVFKRIRID